MYKQIDSNKWKSRALVVIFMVILIVVGYTYGYYTGDLYSGIASAFFLSVIMTLVSWFAGDKVILATSGAHEIKTRDENPYLWNLVENLAITAGIPKPRLYVIDDPAPNAFATGRSPKVASIALTTGIVSLLENEELEGVIAHELSHVKNLDTRFMMLVAVLIGGLSLLTQFFFHGSVFGLDRRRRDRSEGADILAMIGIVFLILAPIIGNLIKLAISRKREYLADASGALLTRYPEGLARALEKIRNTQLSVTRAAAGTAHLWIANPFREKGSTQHWLANLLSTHPPIEDRVRELRLMEKAA